MAVFALALLRAPGASAGGSEKSMDIRMYGHWVNEDVQGRHSEFGNLEPLEQWTIVELTHNRWTRVAVTYAAQDSFKIVRLHDYYVHRIVRPRQSLLAPWLSDFIAGYFVPPFGREWSGLNPFQVGTVRYASVSDSLVARDAGIQLNLRPVRSLQPTVALFLDDRDGGYKGEVDNTHRHWYFRARYPLPYGAVAGVSYRWSTRDRRPWLVEFTREQEGSLYAFELLHAQEMTQWYALAEHDIRTAASGGAGRIRAVARFESLPYGERLTAGCAWFPFGTFTGKVNVASEWFGGPVTRKLLLQALIHFSP